MESISFNKEVNHFGPLLIADLPAHRHPPWENDYFLTGVSLSVDFLAAGHKLYI